MKTLKLALVATLVAIAMVSVASADGFKSKPPKFKLLVSISIERAMQDPGLVTAMYAQLDEDDILKFGMPPFTFKVTYNGALYQISGTREQWIRFFRQEGTSPVNSKDKMVFIE